ncbi:Cation/calcium exchanger 5 [Acorus gramineus]|uniref:Cation/calcium exchanger 5 n=1 Tax=Acorus gramineus TaxID=55184 RepID=A0AAV9A1G0_ACOGR|nr:Cation/calcium exchanger 5 [Acorus gramineus]
MYPKATSLPLLLTLLLLLPTKTIPNPIPNTSSLQNQLSPPPPPPTCSSILHQPPKTRCSFSLAHCTGDSNGLFNYASLHFCLFNENHSLSLPSLSLILAFHFYFLIRAASDFFSPVVSSLSSRLRLSPSTAAVTLLALGNGAPDVFASVAAVRGGHARTGFGAILSAGAFVSAFVFGAVAVIAAPFPVDPTQFVRDAFFYLVSASALFYVYLSAEIYLWQAVGFVGFYVFFVGLVFWMDLGGKGGGFVREEEGKGELGVVGENKVVDVELENGLKDSDDEKSGCSFSSALPKIARVWQVPVSTILKLTIPSTMPSKWSRFYISANIGLCPLALLYSCSSFISMDHRIVFLLPHSHFPLWPVVLFVSSSLGFIHYMIEKDPPDTEQLSSLLMAFVMSVFWISTMAGELLDCLAAFGVILKLPPALLGLTVLAWGNSVGDLVADVAIAKAGQPAMAIAGCFAGPMFNMLVGLGAGLVIETAAVYPLAYELRFHVSIIVAFVFLLLSLMGSLLVMTWFRFRVPRFWGFCLINVYVLFIAVSLAIAKFVN